MPGNVGSALFSSYGASGLGTAPGLSQGNGSGTSVSTIKFSVSAMFLIAVGALVLLHRAGFRFSVTVG